MAESEPEPDPAVARLARLFERHPAWIEAAETLAPSAASAVYFRHLPGRVWRLVFRDGRAWLERGRAESPDLALCFSPAAIERLAAVRGGIGAFAVALFAELPPSEAAAARDDGVDLRVIADYPTLARKGYARLLLAGGWRVLAYGAARGIRSFGELRRLVERLRSDRPRPWEHVAEDARRG